MESFGRAKNRKRLASLYKAYVNRCKDQGIKPIEKKHWLTVNKQYCDDLFDYIFEGHGYHLPAGIGYLRLTKKRCRYVHLRQSREELSQMSPEEAQKVKESGEFKLRINWELEGYLPALRFDTKRSAYPNRSVFEFRLLRRAYQHINRRWTADRNLLFRYINYKDQIQ